MIAYYNEFDPYAAQWLRNLIAEGLIPRGYVDERSIVDVHPDDIRGYRQCHFFAGIGGWPLAARLAGWPDDLPLWTGSPPCQPFSNAGKRKGAEDERHLWPELFRLVRARRPVVFMGEQVAAAVGKAWLDGVLVDLEGIGYAGRAAVVPACAVNAPHRRDRLWFVADPCSSERGPHAEGRHDVDDRADAGRQEAAGGFAVHGAGHVADPHVSQLRGEPPAGQQPQPDGHAGARDSGHVVDPHHQRREELRGAESVRAEQSGAERAGGSAWADHEWIIGADGKARRVKPGVRLLAHGVPARVAKLRALGNAIVAPEAAEVIGAYLDEIKEIFS